jgi:hypothetical protein
MVNLREDFTTEPSAHWRRVAAGRAALESTGASLRLSVSDAPARPYSNAQIDDYQGLRRRRFPWSPPLRLTVRARFSHPPAAADVAPGSHLLGTAGFGFWNDPLLMTGARWPALPRAVWFFYSSPESNLKLDLYTPGPGWKAATIDMAKPIALPLAALAPVLVPLMNIPRMYRAIWPAVQRALKIRERSLDVAMTDWHTYQLDWDTQRTGFRVDGAPVLEHAPSPRGPLGFVMWMDNQAMVVTPWGRLGWSSLPIPGCQWMEVSRLEIEPGNSQSPTL